MSWRENLVPASFRRVNFHVLSSDYSVGRRNVLHQYPLKDVPNVEDLGLDADEFSIDCYVIQNKDNDFDYFKERDALITEIKRGGTGTLIHPFFGRQKVSIFGKARIRESFSEGGWARFTINFVLAGENQYPSDSINPIGEVDKVADDLIDETQDDLTNKYKKEAWATRNMPDIYKKFTASVISALGNIKGGVQGSINFVKQSVADTQFEFAALLAAPCAIGGLINDIGKLILGLKDQYNGTVIGICSGKVRLERIDTLGEVIRKQLGITMTQALLDIVGNKDDEGYGKAYTSTANNIGALVPINVTTEGSAYRDSNKLSFVNTVKVQFLANACKVAIRTDYDSYTQAKSMLSKIIDSMDYLLTKLGDESASDPHSDYGIYIDNKNIYGGIESLKYAFLTALNDKFLNLPIEIEYECPPDGTTTLQLAYDQYNDLDHEESIFTRNQPTINHPGFLNGTINILNE